VRRVVLSVLAGVLGAAEVHAAPRSLTIDDAVALALRASPRLASARARREASEASATSAGRRMVFGVHVSDEFQRWNAPFAIAFGMPGSGMPPVAFVAREQTTNTLAVTADQPLLGLGRAEKEREALVEQTSALEADVSAAESDIRQAVETQFIRFFEARALEDIAAASVKELSDQVTVAKARLGAGTITRADLLRIEVAVANAQQQRLAAESQQKSTRAQLMALMGVDPSESAELTLVEPTARLMSRAAPRPLATLLPEARQRRPDLTAQSHLVLSAQHTASARNWAMLPDIDLEGGYLHLNGQPFQPVNSAYIGVKANWAIWEWGATDMQRRAAQAQHAAAERDRETLERQIEAELTASLADDEAARGAVGSAETAVTSAEEAYRVTQAAVNAGAATTTDLLQAEAELTQARLNLTRANYELALSQVAITHATGGVGL